MYMQPSFRTLLNQTVAAVRNQRIGFCARNYSTPDPQTLPTSLWTILFRTAWGSSVVLVHTYDGETCSNLKKEVKTRQGRKKLTCELSDAAVLKLRLPHPVEGVHWGGLRHTLLAHHSCPRYDELEGIMGG